MLALRIEIGQSLIVSDESTGQELGRLHNLGSTRVRIGIDLPAHFAVYPKDASAEKQAGIKAKARAAAGVPA